MIIPSYIADHQDIDSATALLFGRLNALSNKEGYCFASDEYLAECSKCKIRVISDRLRVLKELGYIKVFTKKIGVIWDRKIYTCNNYSVVPNDEPDDFENIITNSTETPIKEISTKRTNVRLEPHKRAEYKNKKEKDKNKKEKIEKKESSATASPPKVFLKYKEIEIEEEALNELVGKYGDDYIRDKLDAIIDHQASKKVKYYDYAATVRSWIRRDEEFKAGKPASKEKQAENDLEFLEKVNSTFRWELEGTGVHIGPNYFQVLSGNFQHAYLTVGDKNFQSDVIHHLRNRGFNINKLEEEE